MQLVTIFGFRPTLRGCYRDTMGMSNEREIDRCDQVLFEHHMHEYRTEKATYMLPEETRRGTDMATPARIGA